MAFGIENAEQWNAQHHVGTPVEFWQLRREGAGEFGYTRTRAWTIGGVGVVAVTKMGGRAIPGGIALSHIRVRAE